MTKLRKTLIPAACTTALLGVLGIGAPAAFADPITCPNGQVSEQTSPSVFECVNGGGNTSNADDSRNPNR